MTPRTALGLDTICWLFATLAAWKLGYTAIAVALGVFATIYLYRCVKVMVQITKAEQAAQTMQLFDDEFEDPRDYH